MLYKYPQGRLPLRVTWVVNQPGLAPPGSLETSCSTRGCSPGTGTSTSKVEYAKADPGGSGHPWSRVANRGPADADRLDVLASVWSVKPGPGRASPGGEPPTLADGGPGRT